MRCGKFKPRFPRRGIHHRVAVGGWLISSVGFPSLCRLHLIHGELKEGINLICRQQPCPAN